MNSEQCVSAKAFIIIPLRLGASYFGVADKSGTDVVFGHSWKFITV